MRLRLVHAVLMLLGLAAALEAAPPILLKADRSDPVYRCGETVSFKIIPDAGVTGPFSAVAGSDETSAPVEIAGDTIRIAAEKPGFILVRVTGRDRSGQTVTGLGGAAVEPEKIRPGRPEPEDFDAYWAKELTELRSHPLEVERRALPAGARLPAGFAGFDVTLRRGDLVATGFLVLPSGAGPKSLPAVANFLGASKVTAELPQALNYARIPAISFNLNFHGLDNQPAGERTRRDQVRGYQFQAADRQSYPMRKIFLRVVMVMDFLQTLPEYDGRHLVAAGGSLGGCQAAVAAALVPEVTFCVSNATAMCDHFGAEAGRRAGWPRLLARTPAAAETAGYFDIASFTPRIKCPVRMSVGFIDTVTPPESTYAAYNMLGDIDKKMYHVPTSGHGPNIIKGQPSVFGRGIDEAIRHCGSR